MSPNRDKIIDDSTFSTENLPPFCGFLDGDFARTGDERAEDFSSDSLEECMNKVKDYLDGVNPKEHKIRVLSLTPISMGKKKRSLQFIVKSSD